MKTLRRAPRSLVLVTVAALAALPELCSAQELAQRVCEPDVFLAAFTILCATVLLWPRRTVCGE